MYSCLIVTVMMLSILTLLVCMLCYFTDVIQLYDGTGGQMKLLAIHSCERDIHYWQGDDFITMDTIAVWSKVYGSY